MLRSFLLIPFGIGLLFLSTGARADALDDILEAGVIRVGVAEFVPWTMRGPDGEVRGFEVDVARKIARDMGVRPRLVAYEWEEIIPALRAGEIDMIAGGMAITPARALLVNFTRPISRSGVGLAAGIEKTRGVESLEALDREGVLIGTVAETLGAEVARTLFVAATVRPFPTAAEAEQALLDGRAHAYVASVPEVRFLALRHPDRVDVPLDAPLLASVEGLAVRKGEQELLNFLDAWVTAHSADRWLENTHEYWFGTLDWLAKEED